MKCVANKIGHAQSRDNLGLFSRSSASCPPSFYFPASTS